MVKRGTLPEHVLAGTAEMGVKMRYLLRTGKMRGKAGKKERSIVMMQEEKRKKNKETGTLNQDAAGPSASASEAVEAKGKATEQSSSLYRKRLEQEAEKERRAAVAAEVRTPAALSFLDSLRAEMGVSKQPDKS